VVQVPALREASCYNDLFEWLVDVIKETSKTGQRPLFPALNRYHIERDEPDEPITKEQDTMLAKRNFELESELEQMKMQIADLRKDNDRLLKSTKNWHLRYEEMLDSGQAMSTLLETPRKHRVIDFCSFEDDS
jgi:predicted nuclease with TOPRIM domain